MLKKKLIEVAIPLEKINIESTKEKNIRQGHPSTMHLWWARRPLSTARAVLWASLVDDPSSNPDKFKTEQDQINERLRLFKILEDLIKWENINNIEVLNKAKKEIENSNAGKQLEFLDPFGGGGTIPLEALRLGLKTNSSDLNPVAVVINKSLIEIAQNFLNMPPVNRSSLNRIGSNNSWNGYSGLVEDIEFYANKISEEVKRRIGQYFPEVKLQPDQTGKHRNVVAWIWARTVKCPNPLCGCEMPLASTFVLSKTKGNEAWIETNVVDKRVKYTVHYGKCPKEKETIKVGRGASFKCVNCGAIADSNYIREEFISKRNGQQLMAIVAEGMSRKVYLTPEEYQELIIQNIEPNWIPYEEMNQDTSDLVSGRGYGIKYWNELFTNRQLLVMSTFSDVIKETQIEIKEDAIRAGVINDTIPLSKKGKGAEAYSQAIAVYLSLILDKLADYNSSYCSWSVTRDGIRNTFSRQAIPMVWDYAEVNPFSSSTGSWKNMINWVTKSILNLPISEPGKVRQFDAQSDLGLRNIVVSTDPPYYDNIDYADLSDFFYVWMRKTLKNIYPDLFKTMLVPKFEELVALPHRFDGDSSKAKEFFENGMYTTFQQVYKYACDDIPVTIYYAFKQSETEDKNDTKHVSSSGWETMLSAIIRSGFAITGTWPMRTEMANRTIGIERNALTSSIVLVCRKREFNNEVCTRREFINELKRELKPALIKLQNSNIAPVDLAQSAIGPGIGVFSRFSKVLEADGTQMSVRTALQIINQELDLYFEEMDGELDKESRFCLELFTQNAFNEIKFGEADVLARAKNTSVEKLENKGILKAQKGVVRLLTREELPSKINVSEQNIWLLTQQLTNAVNTGGVTLAAKIISDLIGVNVEHAKALCYRLYTISERKGWTLEAFSYNALVSAWLDIQQVVNELESSRNSAKQISFFE